MSLTWQINTPTVAYQKQNHDDTLEQPDAENNVMCEKR